MIFNRVKVLDGKIKKFFPQGPSLPGPDLAFKAGVPQTPLPKYHRQTLHILSKSRQGRPILQYSNWGEAPKFYYNCKTTKEVKGHEKETKHQ